MNPLKWLRKRVEKRTQPDPDLVEQYERSKRRKAKATRERDTLLEECKSREVVLDEAPKRETVPPGGAT